jgi:hypothetical protein
MNKKTWKNDAIASEMQWVGGIKISRLPLKLPQLTNSPKHSRLKKSQQSLSKKSEPT